MANIIKRVWNQNRMVQIEDLRGMTFQAEAAGHTFQISGIDDEGNTVALTGTPSGVLLRPDNTDVALTCSVSGGVVSATLPANCYDVPGRFGLTIFITSGSSKTAIYAAVGTVTRTSSGTVAPGTSQSVVDLINAINAAVNSIPASYSALLADIAPTYSNSALYSVGQYAWYDGDLKRCIVPITTAESYTAAHWTSAVLGQDVSDLKSALDIIEGKESFTWEDGKFLKTDGSTGTASNYSYTTNFIPVVPGTKIIVCTKINGNAAICVYRSDKTTIDAYYTYTSDQGGVLYSYIITLSDNAAFVRFSCGTTEKSNAYILKEKENKLVFDKKPVKDSTNPVESNGIYVECKNIELFDGINIITDFTKGYGYNTTGSTINVNTPETYANMFCAYSACSAGDKFTYYGQGTSSYRQYAFVDSNGTILEIGMSGYQSGLVITAPANSAYVVFNFHKDMPRYVWKGAKEKTGLVEITNFHSHYGYKTTESTININSPTSNSSVDCTFVACKKGDQFTYSGKGSTSYRSYAFIDASGNVLYVEPSTDTFRERVIIAPENSAYVIFNYTRVYAHAIFIGADSESSLFNFSNANIAIIGDSISTNGDYSASNQFGNVPEIVIKSEDVGVELSAYATYYDIGTTVGGHEIVAADVGTEITFTPVAGDVGKFVGKPKNNNAATVETWWEVARGILGFNPIPVCWSGASITSHEGTDNEYKTSYAWHPAQVRKCGIRTPGTMTRTAPDMIIIYRGTNDFSHSPYSKLTADYFESYPWTYPDTDAVDGGYGYKEGLCLTIRKLREAYPKAKIVLCTCNFFKRVNYSSYPINNGLYTENQLNNAIREVANYMGCGLIEFDKDGLTYENASSTYYQDSSAYTHPTTAGHKILGNKALRDLLSENNML